MLQNWVGRGSKSLISWTTELCQEKEGMKRWVLAVLGTGCHVKTALEAVYRDSETRGRKTFSTDSALEYVFVTNAM